MKKILFCILILGLAGGAYYLWSGNKPQEEVELQETTSRPDPSDATFQFEDGPVTLKDGESSVAFEGSVTTTDTSLGEDIVYGDVNADGKNDAVVLLIQNSGGSGIFVYVAAYVSGNVAYKGSNAVFVGDRVSPQTITVGNTGIITLTYLDRGPEEAMAAAPTVSKTKQYVFKRGVLEER